MIKFYDPTFGSRRDDAFARFVGYETDALDGLEFMRAKTFDGTVLNRVRLWLGDGEIGDFMDPADPCDCNIFSDRAARIIASRAGNAVQFFDAPLYRRATGEKISGYKALNATRAIRCIDLSKAKVLYREDQPDKIDVVHKWIFDESIIPKDLHVFRPAEYLAALYFSKTLMEEMMSAEPPFKDLAFLEYGGDEVVTIRRESRMK